MKLQYWRIAGLGVHDGFSVLSIHDVPGKLEIELARYVTPKIEIKINFVDHCGVMYCDEFGMEGYIADSPVIRGDKGSNFFKALDSEFKALRQSGDVNIESWSSVSSYIIVDADYWIEILSKTPPEFQIK
jgi:hypothetical protein